MSIVLGRLVLEDPDGFPETMGEAIARVGAAPVPGARAGLSVSAALSSWADTSADRERVRRQLRSLVNNLPMRLAGCYLAWSEDPELNGWYVPGTVSSELDGVNLSSAVWKFAGLELALVGRRRTHRRAAVAYLRDRRISTTARDTLKRIYSTDFSSLTALALTWLPSMISDPVITSTTSLALTGARAGCGGSSLQAVVGASDLAVVHFEQDEADRNLGDVVAYDRRGSLTAPADGPDADWEEVYGPDWEPTDWLSGADVPVLDNSLCRVRYEPANTGGFAIDRWSGSAWVEQGKVLVERMGDSTGFVDTLVSADLIEWTPDRAVVRAVMLRAADTYSREEIFITLQRGWSGPRIECYPAREQAGTVAGAGIHWYAAGAPAIDVAAKVDAAGAGVAVHANGNFTPGAVGAATFTGENWLSLLRSGASAELMMAALQAGASGRVENGSEAYGAARNGLAVELDAAGYISAHLGMAAQADHQDFEAEAMTLAAGTSAAADATALGGSSAQASSTTANRDHVTQAAWLNSARGKYRIFARVRTSGGTMSIRAVTTATTGATKTTASTTYVWLDLGDITADGSTLTIDAWNSTAVTYHVDRIQAFRVEDRTATSPAYLGARDLGQSVLYDSRSPQTVIAR